MSNVLPRFKQVMILRALGMGTPIRHIEHIVGVAQDTVRRYAALAGEMAIDFIDEMHRDLEIKDIEVDEFYTYVYARRHNVDRIKNKKKKKEAGQWLHFMGVLPKTGFIVNYKVARSNDVRNTCSYLGDLASRLKRNADGSFVVKPTIYSDGHGSYKRAVERVFDHYANYVRLTKQQTDRTEDGKKTVRHFNGVIREIIVGDVEDKEFWTNNIESANRTARAQNRRLARRTNAFSKGYKQHVQQFAFWILYHNYCVVPDRRFMTPAMLAGLAKHKYTPEDLVDLIVLYQAKSKEAGLVREDEDLDLGSTGSGELTVLAINAPFWIYHNRVQKTAKVHRADCCNCRDGMGKNCNAGQTGVWYPAQTLEDAIKRASNIEPEHTTNCSMCLGTYRRLGRRL